MFVWKLGRVLAGLTEAVHRVTSFRLIIEHFRAKSPPQIKGLLSLNTGRDLVYWIPGTL
jgi:hypothetical protein